MHLQDLRCEASIAFYLDTSMNRKLFWFFSLSLDLMRTTNESYTLSNSVNDLTNSNPKSLISQIETDIFLHSKVADSRL